MNNTPRETLRRLIAKYGNDLCGDARRCEGLLKDLCGEYRREINVLTNAIQERIPLDLLAAGNSVPKELLLTRLAKRLEDNLGLTENAAQWAVDSWALALGVVNDGEIAAKERKKVAPPIPPNKAATPPDQVQPTQPKKQPTVIPKSPLPHYPPVLRPPINLPIPAPKSPPRKSGATVNVPQNLPTPNPQTVPKKRFGKFFGCLFVFFLLIITGTVLLFGVPYAINVMRETQQSEPPRFPPQ